MKRHVTAKTAGLAALGILLLGSSIATANITAANTAETMEPAIEQLQIPSAELPGIQPDLTAKCPYLSNGTIERLLAEKTAFRKETRPLIHRLESKWAALSNELAKRSPEETKTARLQDEISALDTRLTEMRLDHLMALGSIKTPTVN